jgi:hypothetical protein
MRLDHKWPSELEHTAVSVLTGKNQEGGLILRIEDAVEPEFGCGNCGTILVVGDPAKEGYFLHRSILLLCNCGAYNTVDKLNGSANAQRLTST